MHTFVIDYDANKFRFSNANKMFELSRDLIIPTLHLLGKIGESFNKYASDRNKTYCGRQERFHILRID